MKEIITEYDCLYTDELIVPSNQLSLSNDWTYLMCYIILMSVFAWSVFIGHPLAVCDGKKGSDPIPNAPADLQQSVQTGR